MKQYDASDLYYASPSIEPISIDHNEMKFQQYTLAAHYLHL